MTPFVRSGGGFFGFWFADAARDNSTDEQHDADTEQVGLPRGKLPEHQLAAEDQRNQQVGDRHERKRRAGNNGAVEVPGHV